MSTKSVAKRLLFLVLAVVWLLVMLFPIVAFTLATQGEIRLGQDPLRQVRIFLVQERNLEGVAIEWTRPEKGQEACATTSVTYFMWQGEGQNARYCQCYLPDATTLSGASCLP